jgi:hypothetical protein
MMRSFSLPPFLLSFFLTFLIFPWLFSVYRLTVSYHAMSLTTMNKRFSSINKISVQSSQTQTAVQSILPFESYLHDLASLLHCRRRGQYSVLLPSYLSPTRGNSSTRGRTRKLLETVGPLKVRPNTSTITSTTIS